MGGVRLALVVIAFFVVTLARCPAYAGDPAYRECDVFNGQKTWCGTWYQGKTIASRDGAYRECDVFNGQITWCGSWYKGAHPEHRDLQDEAGARPR